MAARPVKVQIVYCAECGYEPYTIALTNHLMVQFRDQLSAIEIIPWQDGSFDVTVGGELVHSMYREGGFPEHETIAEAVRAKLAASEAAAG
ncbi:MAG: Rdx family protein [Dehalococcoidia bacterium]